MRSLQFPVYNITFKGLYAISIFKYLERLLKILGSIIQIVGIKIHPTHIPSNPETVNVGFSGCIKAMTQLPAGRFVAKQALLFRSNPDVMFFVGLNLRNIIHDAAVLVTKDIEFTKRIEFGIVDIQPVVGTYPDIALFVFVKCRNEVTPQGGIFFLVDPERKPVVPVKSLTGTKPHEPHTVLQNLEHGVLRQTVTHVQCLEIILNRLFGISRNRK